MVFLFSPQISTTSLNRYHCRYWNPQQRNRKSMDQTWGAQNFSNDWKLGGGYPKWGNREEEIWAIKFEGFPHVSLQFSDQPMCRQIWKESGRGGRKKCFWWVADAQRQVLECFGMVLSNVKQSRAIPTFFFKHKHHKPDLKHSLSIDKGEGTATDGQKHPKAILNM